MNRFGVAITRCLAAAAFVCVFCLTCSALDRDAFTFAAYDLHVRVTPASHALSARGKITLRNDSRLAQRNVSLQISSSLEWTNISLGDRPLPYVAQRYESDIDHTGAVTEAVVTLPDEVKPQQTIELTVEYSGEVVPDATRLTRIGVPERVALQNDWDSISPAFTALRGTGYVCWYPVSMQSVSLSEGAHYFEVLEAWKQRESAATMKAAIEAAGGQTVLANGTLTGNKAHGAIATGETPAYEADYMFARMSSYPPTFSVASYSTLDHPAVTVSYLADHQAAAEQYAAATEKLLPFISEWFGAERRKVQVIELADPAATPFDSGAVVFTPLQAVDSAELEVELAHQLAHACEISGIMRPWMEEGLAHFAQALVREQQSGRAAALQYMDAFLPALQAAENEARGSAAASASSPTAATSAAPNAGQPLIRASDPTYYGIKAMFVWWMLKGIVGNEPLQKAIQAYQPAQDREPSYFQRLLEAQAKTSLEWFFDDWVYRDRGLPDLRISAGFAREMLPGSTAITITVQNLGDAAAEVPVTVRTAKSEETRRVLVKGKSDAVVRFQSPLQPVSAVVNDGSVPETDMTNNTFQFPQKQD